VFRPIRHAWLVEVAHGPLGRSRRLAKAFENTTTSATGWLQVAPPTCATYRVLELTDAHSLPQRDRARNAAPDPRSMAARIDQG